MYCHHHKHRSYWIIVVMFSAFPYLLWQAFGHISGFFVGLVVTAILTILFNNLVRTDRRRTLSSTSHAFSQTREQRQWEEKKGEIEPYQRGYRAQSYHSEQPVYQVEEGQPQYEEMQVPYPQEMPPMEQR